LKISSKEANQEGFEYICSMCDFRKPVVFFKPVDIRPKANLVLELRDKLADMKILPEEAEICRLLAEKIDEWKATLKRVLEKPDEEIVANPEEIKSALRITESIKVQFEENADLRRRMFESVAIPDENAGKPYCICRKPYNPAQDLDMIECDVCHEWFHYKCMGLTSQQVQTLPVWECVNCVASKPAPSLLSDVNKALLVDNVLLGAVDAIELLAAYYPPTTSRKEEVVEYADLEKVDTKGWMTFREANMLSDEQMRAQNAIIEQNLRMYQVYSKAMNVWQ
jgi:hypothetical protein